MASKYGYLTRQQLSVSLKELEMAMDNAGVGATAKQLHAITNVKILANKNFIIGGGVQSVRFAMQIADAPLGRRVWACDSGQVISEPRQGRVSIVDESVASQNTLLPKVRWPTGIRTGFFTLLDAGHLALIAYDFARWANSAEPRSAPEVPKINHRDLITMLKSYHETTSSRSRSSEPLSKATSKISYTEPSPHEHHPGTDAVVEGDGASSDTLTIDTGGIKVRCDPLVAADLSIRHADLQEQSRPTMAIEHSVEVGASIDQPDRSGDSEIEEPILNEATNELTTPGSTTLQKQHYASVADLSKEIGEYLVQNLPGLLELMFCQVPARFDEFLALHLLFGKIRVTKTGCFHRLWIYFQNPKGSHEQKAPSFKLLGGSAIELPNNELGNDENTDDDEIDPHGKEKRKIGHGMLEPGVKVGDIYPEAAFHPVYHNYTQLRAFAMCYFMLVGESDPSDDFNPEIPFSHSFTRALLKACELFKNADFGTEESILEVEEPIRQYFQH